MNTQGIRSDSWAQFVRLAQEARERNQMRTGVSRKTAASAQIAAAKAKMQQVAGSPAASATAAVRTTSFQTARPEVKKLVLGSLFDAYA